MTINLDDMGNLGEEEIDTTISSEVNDKSQVAISLEGNDHIEHLVEKYKWFKDGIDAYKVAVSVALARGKDVVDTPPVTNKKTKYGVSSLDGDGRLRDMIISLRPDLDKRPYAESEWLAEIGLMIIRDELDSGRLLFEILMNKQEESSED
jgi:hypothetical protein